MRQPIRSYIRFLGLIVVPYLLSLSFSTAAAKYDLHLITESDDGVVFEVRTERPKVRQQYADGAEFLTVDLNGCDNLLIPGEPMLPIGEAIVAVPPGKEAVVSIIDSEVEQLASGRPLPYPQIELMSEDYDPGYRAFDGSLMMPDQTETVQPYYADLSIYGSGEMYPAQLISSRPVRQWRHLSIKPIAYHPVRYDTATGSLLWYPRIRVQVTFISSAQTKSMRAQRSRPEPEPRWESIFQRHLINYQRTASYKQAPSASPMMTTYSQAILDPPDFEIALTVERTGFKRVNYEDLVAAGAFSEPVPWSELSLSVREYDQEGEEHPTTDLPVAFFAEDNDDDSHYGPGDCVIFYGQDLWECFDLSPGQKRFGRTNLYWLIGGVGAGTQMAEQSNWHDATGLTPQTSSVQTLRFEENRYYGSHKLKDDDGYYTRGHLGVKTDHYVWTDPDVDQIDSVKLTLPNYKSVSQIDIQLQGVSGISPKCRLWFSETANTDFSNLAPLDTAWAAPSNPYAIGYRDALPISITEGLASFPSQSADKYLKIYIPQPGDGLDNMTGAGVGIDWISVTYEGLLRLFNHRLYAEIEGEGVKQIKLKRLSTDDILVFDVTDPLAPKHIPLSEDRFSPDGTKLALDIQIDFGDVSHTKKLIFLERPDIPELPLEKISVNMSEELPPFAGEDLIMIYPREFAETLATLIAYRVSQGHRVYQAPVEDIYYQYSGGRAHPYAIKRFLREIWSAADPPPDYLLLVGDGSNDIGGFLTYEDGSESWRVADKTFIPVMTLVGHMPGGGSGLDLSSSDQWFVDRLGGSWTASLSTLPDLHIGRIPCGSSDELASYINKIISYETDDVDADWRSRLLIHSDDFYSSSSQPYRYSGELSFLHISKECADSVRAVDAFDHYKIDPFFQSDIMDTIFALGRCVPDSAVPTECWRSPEGAIINNRNPLTSAQINLNTSYGSTTANSMLLDGLSSGALIWAFQGHSNQKLLTHEIVFYHARTGRKDVDLLDNLNRPFFFIGSGCHLGDFSDHREGDRGQSFDSMTEEMLFCCDGESKGAIAIFGSTDYEKIGHKIERDIFDAMFTSPPVVGEGEEADIQWRLGEIITEGKILASDDYGQRISYTYLGDPTLRIGIAPPVFSIHLNNEPWSHGSGDQYISSLENDSLVVSLTAHDDSTIPLPRITDYTGLVPSERLIIEGRESGGRTLVVNYQTQIQRHPYHLKIDLPDREGSMRSFIIDIPLSVAFHEKVGDDLVLLSTGSLVQPTSSLQVTVEAAAHLGEDDFDLLIDGASTPLLTSEMIEADNEPYRWVLEYGSFSDRPLGALDLELRIRQHDGSEMSVAEEAIEIGDEELRFKSVWWIPSPFADESTLVYDLSKTAQRVGLRIFTSSGKCILDQDSDDHEPNLSPMLPTSKGIIAFDAPVWDGRDDDGDPVANGLYFYELSVWDERGKLADRVLEKLVRVR